MSTENGVPRAEGDNGAGQEECRVSRSDNDDVSDHAPRRRTRKPPASSVTPNIDAMRRHVELGHDLIPLHRFDGEVDKWKGGRPLDDERWRARVYENSEVLRQAEERSQNVGVKLRAGDLVVQLYTRRLSIPSFERMIVRRLGFDSVADMASVVPTVQNGAEGFDFYFKMPTGLGLRRAIECSVVGRSFKAPSCIDFKGGGADWRIAAGSVHRRGLMCEWVGSAPTVPRAPTRLLVLATRPRPELYASTRITSDELAGFLRLLDVGPIRARGDLVPLMEACHHVTEGRGREVFAVWSTRGTRYRDMRDVIERRWDSLRFNPTNGLAPRVLSLLAAQEGLGRQLTRAVGEERSAERERADDDFDWTSDVAGAIAPTTSASGG
ncbi:MAG: hypothetical protein AB7O88_00625 [Reyranellaceae bacterium]